MTEGCKPVVVVTGAADFIASHVVELLRVSCEYEVRGTVSGADEAQKARSAFPNVEIFEANLNRDDNWKEAISGSTYVLHLAFPFRIDPPFDEEEVVRLAVDGTRRVLDACVDSGTVRRVVFTTCLAALPGDIGEHMRTLIETGWADPSALGPNEKARQKTERAVYNFMKVLNESERFELVVLNPRVVLGPLLIGPPPPSMQFIVSLMEKRVTGCPEICLPLMDVRDVAKVHVAAMTSLRASGQRYGLFSEWVWLKDMARVITEEFSCLGSTPDGMAGTASEKAFLSYHGEELTFIATKIRQELGIVSDTTLTDTIIRTCDSLMEKGFIVPRPRRGCEGAGEITGEVTSGNR